MGRQVMDGYSHEGAISADGKLVAVSPAIDPVTKQQDGIKLFHAPDWIETITIPLPSTQHTGYGHKFIDRGRKLLGSVMKNPDAVARFRREIEAAGRLDHPHIVRTLDADEADGKHFLVMELLAGQDLAKHVREHGPPPQPLGREREVRKVINDLRAPRR
jgi:serine/threonine protein kinase